MKQIKHEAKPQIGSTKMAAINAFVNFYSTIYRSVTIKPIGAMNMDNQDCSYP